VLDVYGVPDWAARAGSGCETARAAAFARPPRPEALAAYRALIASAARARRAQGRAAEWWRPVNEPNDPRFISPQRLACAPASPPASPAVYAQLARAMARRAPRSRWPQLARPRRAQRLRARHPPHTSIASFVAALPADVICLAGVWSVARVCPPRSRLRRHRPVGALEAALDARGRCGRQARIWVTEAGGRPRAAPQPPEAGGRRGTSAPAAWPSASSSAAALDARVGAVFQYSFREDPRSRWA